MAGFVVSTEPPLCWPTDSVPPLTLTRSRPSAAVAVIGEVVTALKLRPRLLPWPMSEMRAASVWEVSNESAMFSVAVALPLALMFPLSDSVPKLPIGWLMLNGILTLAKLVVAVS